MSERRDAAAAQWIEDTWESLEQRGGPWEDHARRIRDLVRDGLRFRRTKSRGVVRWTSAAGHEVDLHDVRGEVAVGKSYRLVEEP